MGAEWNPVSITMSRWTVCGWWMWLLRKEERKQEKDHTSFNHSHDMESNCESSHLYDWAKERAMIVAASHTQEQDQYTKIMWSGLWLGGLQDGLKSEMGTTLCYEDTLTTLPQSGSRHAGKDKASSSCLWNERERDNKQGCIPEASQINKLENK